jgi:hypothetical protein
MFFFTETDMKAVLIRSSSKENKPGVLPGIMPLLKHSQKYGCPYRKRLIQGLYLLSLSGKSSCPHTMTAFAGKWRLAIREDQRFKKNPYR